MASITCFFHNTISCSLYFKSLQTTLKMKCSNILFFERQRVNVNKSKKKIVINIFYYLFDANFKSLLDLTKQTNQKIINMHDHYFRALFHHLQTPCVWWWWQIMKFFLKGNFAKTFIVLCQWNNVYKFFCYLIAHWNCN